MSGLASQIPPSVHLPGGGTEQQGSTTQVSGPLVDNGLERVPSWPLRKPISQYNQSIPASQVGQDHLSSPTQTTRKCMDGPNGHEALRRDIRIILKEELYVALASSKNAPPVTDEPSWVDTLKQDMQSTFRKELHERLSSSPDAFVVTEEPVWIGALRRDMQSMLRNGFSNLTRELTTHSNVRVPISDAAATPPEARRAETIETLTAVDIETPRPEENVIGRSTVRPSCITTTDEAILADLRSQLAVQKVASCESVTSEPDESQTSAASIKDHFHKFHQKAYDVRDMYHEKGFFQALARRECFDYCSAAMIVLSSIWMSADSDLNGKDSLLQSGLAFIIADVVFYTYFAGELLIRFMAFKRKPDCYKDGWFVFDSLALILYTLDPFVISIVELAFSSAGNRAGLDTLRLLRLGRLTRLTKLLRLMPEMLIMIKGIVTALATVGYTLGLLGLVTYVFAIALRSTVPTDSKIKNKYFPSIPETMHNLVIHGAFLDDLAEFITAVKNESIVCLMLSWLFVILSALLIMNMLIGVLCQVIATVARHEKECLISEQIYEAIFKLMSEFDANDDGLLDWEEFARLLGSEDGQNALRKFDVDLDAFVDMVEDMFFYSYGATRGSVVKRTITYTEIIELILQLRGSQPASVKDVMAIGKRLNARLHELKGSLPTIAPPSDI